MLGRLGVQLIMLPPSKARTAAAAALNAEPAPRLQGLAPHVGIDTRLLLLGSFPGVASLQAQQYYGHPRNQFWRLLGDVLGLPLAGADYAARLQLLRAHRVGLWDVITETERIGSLDSKIRDPRASDLAMLLGRLPALRTIGFNGGTALRIGLRQLGERAAAYRILALPSSSPAYTLSYEDKLRAWQQLALPT
jgi:hypoxanthine-DNA glycosylase